jgi:hypothetical protein
MSSYLQFKGDAIRLRRNGSAYTEIQGVLNSPIPPSTLCTWFKQVEFSSQEKEHILLRGKERIRNGSVKASATRKLAKKNRLEIIHQKIFILEKY